MPLSYCAVDKYVDPGTPCAKADFKPIFSSVDNGFPKTSAIPAVVVNTTSSANACVPLKKSVIP